MTSRRSLKWWGLAAGLTVVIVGGAAAVWPKEKPTVVPSMVVKKETFVRRVTAEGNLRAVKATPLTPPTTAGGALKIAWLEQEGKVVRKGDVVVRFDPTDMAKQLEDGNASLTVAKAKIAKERLQTASTGRDRARNSTMARQALDTTREFQSKDQEIFSRNQIIESKIDESLSGAKLDHAGAAEKLGRRVSRSKLEILAIQKKQAEFTVAQAKEGLKDLSIVAPHDGLIVHTRNWRGQPKRVGETVWRGQKIMELPLVDEMEAEVFVLEADAGGLAEEQPATIVLDAYPDKKYKASVLRVAKLAQRRQHAVPVQYFAVTLVIERTDTKTMKPGQRVRAQLVLDKSDAIVVPRQTIFDKAGSATVYRWDKDHFESVKVKLGSSTPGRVVVVEGLRAGDRIALRDPTLKLGENTKSSSTKTGQP